MCMCTLMLSVYLAMELIHTCGTLCACTSVCSRGDIVTFPVFPSRPTAIFTYLPLPALS